MSMNWVILALISAFFYGAYNFFIKLTSDSTHQILGAVILQASALSVGLVILFYLWRQNETFPVTSKGVSFAILAGITAGLAEIVSFYVFSQGISASRGIPVIIGGSVVAGSLLGLLFLRESIGFRELLGVALVVGGIWMLTGAEKTGI